MQALDSRDSRLHRIPVAELQCGSNGHLTHLFNQTEPAAGSSHLRGRGIRMSKNVWKGTFSHRETIGKAPVRTLIALWSGYAFTLSSLTHIHTHTHPHTHTPTHPHTHTHSQTQNLCTKMTRWQLLAMATSLSRTFWNRPSSSRSWLESSNPLEGPLS